MRTEPKPLGQAMYVAAQLDRSWVQNAQRDLYKVGWTNPDYVFRKLWGFVTDPRNLRVAFARVASNRGRRTAGIDGVTVRRIVADEGIEDFLVALRTDLRSGQYRPSATRRVMIPKPAKPGEYRPLGIPTVRDRVVQAAMKNIMEPIFEADFFPCSYGFRPGRGAHAALEKLRLHLRSKRLRTHGAEGSPYSWAIEGDIKGCFDNIDHHGLMTRVRRRIGDAKLNRLVLAFLRAGVLAEGRIERTVTGTPQGGILSPLLANIALSAIDERYARHVWPRDTPTRMQEAKKIRQRAINNRQQDKKRGRPVLVPIRYADDFIILVDAPESPGKGAREVAFEEKAALAEMLQEELGLELSEHKTLVTPVTEPMRFLGHHVRVQRHRLYGWLSNTVIPKDRSRQLREAIKRLFDNTTCNQTLASRLVRLNPLLRGWGNFYRHARGAKQIFNDLDRYVWWTIRRWLRKKHQGASMRQIQARYGWRKPRRKSVKWQDGGLTTFELMSLRVERYQHRAILPPFAIYGEPGAQRKEHAGFGRGGLGDRRAQAL